MKVALAGFGAIGSEVARRLLNDGVPGVTLSAVAARDHAKARAALDRMGWSVPVMDVGELAAVADLVVECAPAALMDDIARPVLTAGKKLVVLSVGALLTRPHLVELARKQGGQIIVPSGALLGLDAVCAAAEGQIHAVQMTTRKPPNGLAGAPYLLEHNIKIDGEDSWIKYEASTVKGDKETDQQVHDRLVGLVSTRVIEAAHVAVQTIENVKADAQ